MAVARIGRVRLKAGGAEVRLLRRETPNRNGDENWAGDLMAGARRAIEFVPENGPISGYVLVAFYADGSTLTSQRWGDESPLNRSVHPRWKIPPSTTTSNSVDGTSAAALKRNSLCQWVPNCARHIPWNPPPPSRGPVVNAENSPTLKLAVR